MRWRHIAARSSWCGRGRAWSGLLLAWQCAEAMQHWLWSDFGTHQVFVGLRIAHCGALQCWGVPFCIPNDTTVVLYFGTAALEPCQGTPPLAAAFAARRGGIAAPWRMPVSKPRSSAPNRDIVRMAPAEQHLGFRRVTQLIDRHGKGCPFSAGLCVAATSPLSLFWLREDVRYHTKCACLHATHHALAAVLICTHPHFCQQLHSALAVTNLLILGEGYLVCLALHYFPALQLHLALLDPPPPHPTPPHINVLPLPPRPNPPHYSTPAPNPMQPPCQQNPNLLFNLISSHLTPL